MSKLVETIQSFAKTLHQVQRNDMWALFIVDGDQGQGKSCFTSQVCEEVAKLNEVKFTYSKNMTFTRKRLKEMIDGSKDVERLPEYSAVDADEIVSLFFKRNWFDADQIDGIELLNKCRDRHLVVGGNLPSFWDLDSALYSIVTFRVHIPRRGVAWVFMKDPNPFTVDSWHKKENEKIFRKHKNPAKCKGFVCVIKFNDWPPAKKAKYYAARNKMRLNTEGQRSRAEKYKDIKEQRDKCIRWVDQLELPCDKCKVTLKTDFTNKDYADVLGLSAEAVRLIRNGER